MGLPRAVEGDRRVRAFGGYQPTFDGMRGVAMLLTLAYHGRLPHSEGAFLGVSQFFTLSGFLITAIVLDGRARTGSIDLRRFWSRRLRRLAPAALLGLAAAVAFGATIATRSQAERLPEEILGAATYVVNWVFIATDQSYVDLFASPSPVQHFWSLAIEEQFYVLLPLGLVGLLRLGASHRGTTVAVAVATIAATAWTAVLFGSGAQIDRLYYGTDTRLPELLVGVLLACVLHALGTDWTERTRRILAGLGVAALAACAWAWFNVSFTDALPWRGGMLVHGALVCVILAALVGGRGPLPLLYGFAPLVAFGRITYGVYVFHWPIFLWLDEERLGLDTWPLLAVRVAVTLAVAIPSYLFIERPIRDGATLGLPARWRGLLVPSTAALLVVAGFATTRAASDPLATLRTDDDSFAIPIATADGVLDIVAIGDPSDGALESLVGVANAEPQVRAVDGGTLDCTGGTVPVSAGRTCARWAEEWPALVAAHDPDVVVLYVDRWSGDDLATLAVGVPGGQTAVATELLTGGLDLLSSDGAHLVWATPGADLATALGLSNEPLRLAFDQLTGVRSDLFHVGGEQLPVAAEVPADEYRQGAAEALLTSAGLYQRSDRADLPRVMVIGDSQARSLGYGLERWGAADTRAWVWNVAVEGCGVLPHGGEGADESVVPERCRDLPHTWQEQVDRFDPDLVVVLSSVYDLGERRLTGGTEPVGPGDPSFDAFLVGTYADAVDILGSTGADVVWMQPPCAELRSGQPGIGTTTIDPAVLTHLNDDLLPAVVAERPGAVQLFDLDAVLCPNGEARQTTDDGDLMRFDGVHFTVEGSLWFADAYGPALLDLREGPMTTVDGTGSAPVLDAADRLVAEGAWLEAVDLLRDAIRRSPDRALEERLVRVRHGAFAALEHPTADPSWPPDHPDRFAGCEGIPELDAAELDAGAIGSALQHNGSLLVRGLLEPEVAASLRDEIVLAFDASAASADGAPPEDTSPYFLPFEADEGYSFGFFEQYAARAGGGVLLAESPRLQFRIIEEYRRIGLGDVLAGYLGEWPALSVKKSTLRRASRESGRGWHQDGRFLGEDVHTVNVWTALTPCGTDAPSVDVFAMAFDHIVETGTEGADHPWSVSRDVAAGYGLDRVVRPVFAAGDALLFNQMTLHESGIGPHMTETRYAIESWFFGPSTYPHEQVPVVF